MNQRIVNVASVPQRSVFRYPGGKTWLVPYVRAWLGSGRVPSVLVEPFAGGGIVGLTAAFEGLAKKVILVELDEDVGAVWQTILGSDATQLMAKIASFELTVDTAKDVLESTPRSTLDRAFQTVLRNRVNHGGILAPGSGVIKNGENGKGIASRWYPETLRKRIQSIQSVKSRIEFISGDGLDAMERFAELKNTAFFIDPPYTAGGKRAGSRLYTHNQVDHERLFRLASSVCGPLLMTYDDAPEVRDLTNRNKLACDLVSMKNTHHAKMTELLIGHNLDWLDRMRPAAPSTLFPVQ